MLPRCPQYSLLPRPTSFGCFFSVNGSRDRFADSRCPLVTKCSVPATICAKKAYCLCRAGLVETGLSIMAPQSHASARLSTDVALSKKEAPASATLKPIYHRMRHLVRTVISDSNVRHTSLLAAKHVALGQAGETSAQRSKQCPPPAFNWQAAVAKAKCSRSRDSPLSIDSTQGRFATNPYTRSRRAISPNARVLHRSVAKSSNTMLQPAASRVKTADQC